jgi:dynein heavy chain
MIWALGGLYELSEREQINQFLLDNKEFPVPRKGSENETIFEYYIRFNAQNEAEWTLCQPDKWSPPKNFKFSRVILPTVDTMRAEILIDFIADNDKDLFFTQASLLLGMAGT